jgi:hypothetical protein
MEGEVALMREVRIGFRGANNKIERVSVSVPAEWISGNRDAKVEILENEKLRTRLSVNPDAAVWIEISDPYNDTPGYVV